MLSTKNLNCALYGSALIGNQEGIRIHSSDYRIIMKKIFNSFDRSKKQIIQKNNFPVF